MAGVGVRFFTVMTAKGKFAIQYCPVNLRGIGEKANSGAAFRVTSGVSDLNRK
jgi:hypothetical protein